jgi:hypothetical protein
MKPTTTKLRSDLIKNIVQEEIWFYFIADLHDIPKLMTMAADVMLHKWEAFFDGIEIRRIRGEISKLDTTERHIRTASWCTWARIYKPLITQLLNARDMMDLTVVENQDTARGGIGIHDTEDAFKPFYKLVTVVAADLDMAVNNAINRDSREHRVARNRCIVSLLEPIWFDKGIPGTTYKIATLACSKALDWPSISSVSG